MAVDELEILTDAVAFTSCDGNLGGAEYLGVEYLARHVCGLGLKVSQETVRDCARRVLQSHNRT